MEIIKLNLSDLTMMDKLMPLYFKYESDLTKLRIEEMFNQDKPEENKKYFIDYFSRGIKTLLLVDENNIIGFISYHIDLDDVPGYAKGFKGYGHIAEIFIDHKYRQKGYAKILVKEVEEIFKKINLKELYLVDINQNEIFWENLKYINTGMIEPEENGIIFTKKLN